MTHTADRILVVDDSQDNLFLIESLLESEGHEILLANNGFQAWEIILEHPPDLILLDVMMPGMDGFELTDKIRRHTNLPFIPIVLITAYEQMRASHGLDLGADDFVRKPFELDELLARVRSLLRLKHSVDEREEMNRQREDFVSRLTHDLRTPLVAADRMLKLLQEGALGEPNTAMKEAFSTMASSNRNLLEMVNNLLEVHRYEAHRKNLHFQTVHLPDLTRDILQELRPLALEQNLTLELEIEGDRPPSMVPLTVEGDVLELRRVFTNVVSNAIKFTPTGKITIAIGLDHQPHKKPRICWRCTDTGTGISPEEQQALFDRFRQGKHRHGGSGLGLYLSRHIVEFHHGEITVQSQPGQGTTFFVYLPCHGV